MAQGVRRVGALLLVLLLAVGAVAEDGTPDAKPAPGKAVRFEPGMTGAATEPRFGAVATEVELKELPACPLGGFGHLEGHMPLGPNPGKGRPLVLLRSSGAQPYDTLILDLDGNGSLDGERPLRTKLRESKDGVWSTFEAVVRINHGTAASPIWENFALGLWAMVAKRGDVPTRLFFVRHGFREGQITLGEEKYDVVLSDSHNDGVYGKGDLWTIRPAGIRAPYQLVEPPPTGTRDELLACFDANVDTARTKLDEADDKTLMGNWTLRTGDVMHMTMPRIAVLRSFVMNHLIHHRGQLSVYLRLKDVPVPSIYGPSADEAAF